MAGETQIDIIGNLTADPELRFTPQGLGVANFTVASTPRVFNRETSQWDGGDTLFLRVQVWRQQAEHVVESLKKGDRVMVSGVLKQRSYETREGEKRTVYEVEATEVGASLLFRSFVHQSSGRSRAAASSTGQEADPWASSPTEEPPF